MAVSSAREESFPDGRAGKRNMQRLRTHEPAISGGRRIRRPPPTYPRYYRMSKKRLESVKRRHNVGTLSFVPSTLRIWLNAFVQGPLAMNRHFTVSTRRSTGTPSLLSV